ncbi:flagellar motor switch protein FliM [Sanguibacter sp. 4.1]|jgi:flagellar motor switch protein FliM|uniref:Flagellar motor switch protein FliM n=1 Tax=Sanguibacter biliveldensis TaxID=3030830 RepID=A0AAF0Z2D1_9MICO|nr:flagellar motor switch protein FliM [Sanguibacter sp. 4.1]WPF81743.1 flagellar motor switch protein FliM [Sanguibacter sp. 4.1]
MVLFVTVQDKTRPAVRRQRPAQPEAYDFRRPMTLAREHGRAFEMAFETFARQWGTQLTSRLRVMVGVGLDGVEMVSYDEYVRRLPTHTTMVLCSIETTRSTAVLQVASETSMLWVDYVLGGPGLIREELPRELTEIETTLITDMLSGALADLRYAFVAVVPLDVRVKGIQYNPQFVQAAPTSEAVIVATFTLTIAERPTTATLMIPADVLLAPLRAGEGVVQRSKDELAEAADASDRLHRTMSTVPVDVSVRMRPVTVHPRDVVNLTVGEVIHLNHPVSRPLDVVVDGIVLARGVAGNNGRQLACKIVDAEGEDR